MEGGSNWLFYYRCEICFKLKNRIDIKKFKNYRITEGELKWLKWE